MTLDKALIMASDTHIDTDPRDGAVCIFVHGAGIELRTDEEKEIAGELLEMINSLAKHAKQV